MRMMNIRAPAALIGILVVFNLALALGLHEGDGLKLLEVFKVTINDIDNEYPGELYGSILATDEFLPQDLFNRDSSNPQRVRAGGDAILTGPVAQVITASNGFTIDVALMDYDLISADDHIADGQIYFKPDDPTNKYDVPISQEITGEDGSVTVVYAVLSNAVQATVEVILINGNGKNPAPVYGSVAAQSTKFSSDFKSVLFKAGVYDYVEVSPAQRMPLSRSIVAVPLDSILQVDVSLRDPGILKEQIAVGTASFAPQLSGTLKQTIDGAHGQIEVKVTWTNSLKFKTTSPLINSE